MPGSIKLQFRLFEAKWNLDYPATHPGNQGLEISLIVIS